MAKRTSKNDRLLAIFHFVYDLRGGKPITTEAVSQWAEDNGLLPVPGIRDPLPECDAWDEKFSKAKALAQGATK
jgi:hypothetical protein